MDDGWTCFRSKREVNVMEKLKLTWFVLLICILYGCDFNYESKNDIIDFTVVGEITNSEIREYIVDGDSLKANNKLWHFAFRDDLRYVLGHDYLIVLVRNNSEYTCKCGVASNGFFATRSVLLLDSIYYAPKEGVIPPPINQVGGTVEADTSILLEPKTSRYFLVFQPFVLRTTSSEMRMVGYIHDCAVVGSGMKELDTSEFGGIMRYFVYEYDGEIRLDKRENIGESMY